MTSSQIIAQHAALRAATVRLWRALRDRLNGACAWVDTHPLTDDLLAALPDPDRAVTGGEGTPLVDPSSVPEFAALLGKPTGAGSRILAEAVELRHRLPRLWARVQRLEVSADDACRVASRTMALDPAAVDWVDEQVVHFVGSLSVSRLDRTVEAAKASAGELPGPVDSGLFVNLVHDTTSVNGHSQLFGELALVDGLELDQALQHGAELQKFWGNPASLDTRRAQALGELARSQSLLPGPGGVGVVDQAPEGSRGRGDDHGLDVAAPSQTSSPKGASSDATSLARPGAAPEAPSPRPPAPRSITLNIVLPVDAVGGATVDHGSRAGGQVLSQEERPAVPVGLGQLINTGSPVTAEQVREWCAAPGAEVKVRPVIDLNVAESTECYTPTARMREHVVLTNPSCVFPWCGVSSDRVDLDHIVPFHAGGPTSTANLAPLCRRHHRVKTFSGWRYARLGPRLFRWTSPSGHQFLRAGIETYRLDDNQLPGPSRQIGPTDPPRRC